MKRRHFLQIAVGTVGGFTLHLGPARLFSAQPATGMDEPYKISLAQWSLNKSIRAGKLTNLDFPVVAKRDYQIDCVEYVDQFFSDKAGDQRYLSELKKRADDEGVRTNLIMIDTTGDLGAPDAAERKTNVEKTYPWIDAAKFLGGRTIRINARGPGNADELRERIVESCGALADYAAQRQINVAIENHGGLSSDPAWLVSVMRAVNRPNFGTLPDFGNFPGTVNRYDAVEMMMPYAKAVSAKAERIGEDGLVQESDFYRMLRFVRDAGYRDYVGIESAPARQEDEARYIRATRDLLLKIRDEVKRLKPLFNRRDLAGWKVIEGGEWRIEDGVLIGANGRNWSTDPEKTGSWLHTEKEYGDFRLELQFTIDPGSNSGVFFRSRLDKNPAFTGYEMQINDAAGRPPTKNGAGSLYALIAPEKNMIRPAGQWNTVTITARGPKIVVELNGEKTIDTEQSRSLRGHIGLQNHDARSVVRFRNLRLEEL